MSDVIIKQMNELIDKDLPLSEDNIRKIYPMAHEKGVVDDNGNTLDNKISSVIEQASSAATESATVVKEECIEIKNECIEIRDETENLFNASGLSFDITKYHSGSTYSGLTVALSDVPEEFRTGGMTVKFVQSSDNKYVHALLKSQTFSTNITDWEIYSQSNEKLIKLTGMGLSGALGGAVNVGDVYYNTETKLLRQKVGENVYETIPYYDGAIYTYNDSLYIWDGTNLEQTLSDRILSLEEYSVLEITGFGVNGAKGGVTKEGDVFYNTNTGLLRRCTTYVSPLFGEYETVQYDDNTVYLNISDNCIYQHINDRMELLADMSFYASNRVIHLNNIGLNWDTSDHPIRLGEIYYNTGTNSLKMCIRKEYPYGTESSETLVSINIPPYYDAIYFFNKNAYKWNGNNLQNTGLGLKTISDVSSSVFMYPGVSDGNGNIWSLTNENSGKIGEKYGYGLFSTDLVEVSFNDVLEINYAKMGIDQSKYKIGIIEYDKDGLYRGEATAEYNTEPTYYLQNTLVSFEDETRYIRFTLYQLDTSSYSFREEFSMPIFFKSYEGKKIKLIKDFASSAVNFTPTFPYIKGLSFPIQDTDTVFKNSASLLYQEKNIGYNNGYIIFPEEYTPHGKGFPLIIFAHGTNGIDFISTTSPTYVDLLKNVSKGGYIVADCSTLSSFYYDNDNGDAMEVWDANYSEPMAWECYHKFFKYIIRRFNIDTEHIYIFGKSAGGLNVIMLSQMGILPIKAAAGLAGSIDLITDMRIMPNRRENINPFLHRISLSDANLANYIGGANDADYLVSHIKELAGFNPLWFKTFNLDKEVQIRRCIIDNINTSNIENDSTLQGVISNSFTSLRIPMKWWQAIDDVNVPIGTTRLYQKMVRNGGGVFEIREFPSGCGAHHAVDNATNAPTTTYIHRNGVQVTLPVAYAEVLDWFNMWW